MGIGDWGLGIGDWGLGIGLQASGPSNARIGIGGSNYGGGFVMESKGYSSYDFDEDEE